MENVAGNIIPRWSYTVNGLVNQARYTTKDSETATNYITNNIVKLTQMNTPANIQPI